MILTFYRRKTVDQEFIYSMSDGIDLGCWNRASEETSRKEEHHSPSPSLSYTKVSDNLDREGP